MPLNELPEPPPPRVEETRGLWSRFSFIFTYQWIPLTLGLLLVIGVGIYTTRTVQVAQDYDERVSEYLTTIGVAEGVLLSLEEMNASQRGLIMSGDRAFAERYARSREAFEAEFANLRALTDEEGLDSEELRNLEVVLEERLEGFAETDMLIAEGDMAAAGRSSISEREEMSDVVEAVDEIKADAYALLESSQVTASASGERALVLNVAGLTIASLLILVSILLLSRRSTDLQRANDEVRAFADTLELRVQNRTADLAEANEEIQRFAYIVSHDLRSPLVNIMGFTAELEEAQQAVAAFLEGEEGQPAPEVPEQVRLAVLEDMPESMNFIRSSTGRMDRLIKAILQISREGRRTMSHDDISLDEMFSELAESLAGQLDEADAVLTLHDLPDVEGDRLALEQIFGNLLDNAVKYLKPGVPGMIDVSGEVRGSRAIIYIEDNGRGVAENDKKRIFELFRRAGEQDKPGEGIGLAHVQALVRGLGGKIGLESTLGEGSRFIVALPLSKARRIQLGYRS